MVQSDSSSSLLLIACTREDARNWQREHPELADAVRVVFIGSVRSATAGLRITAAYFTYRAGRHHDAESIADMLEDRIKRNPDRRASMAAHPAGKGYTIIDETHEWDAASVQPALDKLNALAKRHAAGQFVPQRFDLTGRKL